jgi:enoyl-CoA hydratase
MEFKNLLVETTDSIATLTINSPRTFNTLNSAVLRELECALYELNLDVAVKAVVLTGAGEKAFVAGADIKEMTAMTSYEGHQFGLLGQRVMMLIEKMTKPVIAAVNGYALGGGLELALACDFIYASEKAKLGFPEVTLGIMPGFGGTQNLSWGIVNEIFPPEELLAKARETAATIAGVGTLGVSYAKNAIANGLNMTKEDGFRYEASLFGVLFATEDQKEGMGAFVEKRKAEFRGK